jgi:putative membrane protein
VRLFVTGIGMGSADIVPGVSGGTIAFIAGIYEELVHSIRTVTGDVVRLLARGRVAEAVGRVPFPFLLPLGVGLLTAIVTLANLISWALDRHPAQLWAFFFGLVLASVVMVSRRVSAWHPRLVAGFGAATVGAFFVVGAQPFDLPDARIFLVVSGAIASMAMILPGISGSFILIILGEYDRILDAVTERDVVTLGIFLVGVVLGLALFARVLTWLFAHYHDIVVAVLAGFMLGSLRRVWPWKESVGEGADGHAEELAGNVLPPVIDGSVAVAAVMFVIGVTMIIALDRLQVMKEGVEVREVDGAGEVSGRP